MKPNRELARIASGIAANLRAEGWDLRANQLDEIAAGLNAKPNLAAAQTCDLEAEMTKRGYDLDPTPWCHVCGAGQKGDCLCGPIAENH